MLFVHVCVVYIINMAEENDADFFWIVHELSLPVCTMYVFVLFCQAHCWLHSSSWLELKHECGHFRQNSFFIEEKEEEMSWNETATEVAAMTTTYGDTLDTLLVYISFWVLLHSVGNWSLKHKRHSWKQEKLDVTANDGEGEREKWQFLLVFFDKSLTHAHFESPNMLDVTTPFTLCEIPPNPNSSSSLCHPKTSQTQEFYLFIYRFSTHLTQSLTQTHNALNWNIREDGIIPLLFGTLSRF